MKTTRPISTVSFNTEGFLLYKLNELIKSDKLEFWAYIEHQPEGSEGKTHFHVFMLPAVSIDTLALRREFTEPDLQNPLKPLGSLRIYKSKFDDWYFYGMHDEIYLLLKGKKKQIHYKREDFVTSDMAQFNELADNAIRGNEKDSIRTQMMVSAIENGLPFSHLLRQGLIPLAYLHQYNRAWDVLLSSYQQKSGADEGAMRPERRNQ